jgi:hypothetical protein
MPQDKGHKQIQRTSAILFIFFPEYHDTNRLLHVIHHAISIGLAPIAELIDAHLVVDGSHDVKVLNAFGVGNGSQKNEAVGKLRELIRALLSYFGVQFFHLFLKVLYLGHAALVRKFLLLKRSYFVVLSG